jgi:hypothetical protein
MKQAVISFLTAALIFAVPANAASLSSIDADLGRVHAADLSEGLSISVDLGGDVPSATHVIARFQNNRPHMRGTDGLWAPWNGDVNTLDDAGAAIADGILIFDVLEGLPTGLFYPVSFTVVYRTTAGLKSGTIVVDGP